MDYSSLSSLLICNLPLQQWETFASTILHTFPNCSAPAYIYSGFQIVNLYFHGKYTYQLEYSADVQFLLSLVLRTPLISKFT